MGATLNHATLSSTVQLVFEARVNVVDPAGAVTFWIAGNTKRIGAAPAWLTVTTTFGTPVADTVIVPDLGLTEVFSV